jgi:hypothetical protein
MSWTVPSALQELLAAVGKVSVQILRVRLNSGSSDGEHYCILAYECA